MEPGILFFALFFFLLFIGVPIAVSVGITALTFLWQYHLGILVVSTNFFANIAKFPLLAIPFSSWLDSSWNGWSYREDWSIFSMPSSARCLEVWASLQSRAASFSAPFQVPDPQIQRPLA